MATLRGEVTTAPLISLWRHYPPLDLEPDSLVDITLKDHKRFPSDLVKLSPHGRYCVVDFGCKIEPGKTDVGASGSASCSSCIVSSAKHWDRIEPLDPLSGYHGQMIKFVEKACSKLSDFPKMMTVFVPTMVARKLSRNQFPKHLKGDYKKEVMEALEIISKVTIEFARACVDAGAEGIFIATQEADYAVAESPEEAKSLLNLNHEFYKAIQKHAEFTVLHIHGDQAHYSEAMQAFPTTAINWHDQTSDLSIPDARKRFSGGLLAGLNPNTVIDQISSADITQFKEYSQTMPFILAPGCVLLQGTDDNILDYIFKEYRS